MRKKRLYKLYSTSLLAIQLLVLSLPVSANVDEEGYAPRRPEIGCEIDYGEGSKQSSSSSSFSTGEVGNAGGAWTQEGTEEYKIAKQIFDYLTTVRGLSGISAASWVGNMQAESKFNPKMVEAMSEYVTAAGQGYGLVQFTPASVYLDSKFFQKGVSTEQEVKNQLDFVWQDEFSNQVVTAFQHTYPEIYPAIKTHLPRLGNYVIEDWLDSKSLEEGTALFVLYLRPNFNVGHFDRRLKAAELANKMFNQKNIKADRSKWKFGSGIDTTNTPTIQVSSGRIGREECEEEAAGSSSSAPTELLAKWEEVLGYKSKGSGIGVGIDMDFVFGSQCFDLVRYYLTKMITDKNGNSFEVDMSNINANGLGKASTWSGGWEVKQMGQLKASDLKAGDVLYGNLQTERTYGHVVVVLSDVDENGEFLFIDQNTPRPSINKGTLDRWVQGEIGYIRPPAGWRMAENVIYEEYLNDNAPTYPGGWRGGNGISPYKATKEDIKRLAKGR